MTERSLPLHQLDIVELGAAIEILRIRLDDCRLAPLPSYGFPRDLNRLGVDARHDSGLPFVHRPRRHVDGAAHRTVRLGSRFETGDNWCLVADPVGPRRHVQVTIDAEHEPTRLTADTAGPAERGAVVDAAIAIAIALRHDDRVTRTGSVTLELVVGDEWSVTALGPPTGPIGGRNEPIDDRWRMAFPELSGDPGPSMAAGAVLVPAGEALLAWAPRLRGAFVAAGTAAHVLAGLADGVSLDELVSELRDAFPDQQGVERDVRSELSRWIDLGLVGYRGTDAAHPAQPTAVEPAFERAPRIRWNPERRHDVAGTVVRVAYHDDAVASAGDRFFDRADEAAAVDGDITVSTIGGSSWQVASATTRTAQLYDPMQIVPEVRRRMIDIAARAGSAATLHGTVLTRDDASSAVVLIGAASERWPVIKAWFGRRGRVVADDLIVVQDAIATPAYVGVAVPLASGTFAVEPSMRPDLHLDERGLLMRLHRVPSEFRAEGATVTDVVVIERSDDEADVALAPLDDVELCRHLIGAAVVGGPVRIEELGTLAWHAAGWRSRAPWSEPVVDHIVQVLDRARS